MAQNEPIAQKQAEHSPAVLHVCGGRFKLTKLLGKGGFGEVYEGQDSLNPDVRVAVKVERRRKNKYLYHEACIIDRMSKFVDITIGIPNLLYYGDEGDYCVLVMNLMGPSLEDLLDIFGHFSIKTTVMLGIQMVARIEYMHSVGFIHRDVKPENFLMGVGKKSHHVHLIDFGLSTRYKSSNGHRPLAAGRSLIGTCRYASLRTHDGYSQSRRDDLEQLAYTLIYIRRGKLPWTGLRIDDQAEKEKKVFEMKQTLPFDVICKRCPSQFEDLLIYSRKMGHEECPRYEMVNVLLSSILDDHKWENDYRFDWSPKKKNPSPQASEPKDNNAPATPQQPVSPRGEGEDDERVMSISDAGILSTAEAHCLSNAVSGNGNDGDDGGRPMSPISPLSASLQDKGNTHFKEGNLDPGAKE